MIELNSYYSVNVYFMLNFVLKIYNENKLNILNKFTLNIIEITLSEKETNFSLWESF
jgi:hypothetical protein